MKVSWGPARSCRRLLGWAGDPGGRSLAPEQPPGPHPLRKPLCFEGAGIPGTKLHRQPVRRQGGGRCSLPGCTPDLAHALCRAEGSRRYRPVPDAPADPAGGDGTGRLHGGASAREGRWPGPPSCPGPLGRDQEPLPPLWGCPFLEPWGRESRDVTTEPPVSPQLPTFIAKALYTICFIWATSKYYNTPSRVIVILQEFCNQIIELVAATCRGHSPGVLPPPPRPVPAHVGGRRRGTGSAP